jgi:Flp pilus assembly pilin Flp
MDDVSISATGEEIVDTLRPLGGRVYLALSSLRDGDNGQAMVEYALILFLVSIVSLVVLTTFGVKVSTLFSEVNADI